MTRVIVPMWQSRPVPTGAGGLVDGHNAPMTRVIVPMWQSRPVPTGALAERATAPRGGGRAG